MYGITAFWSISSIVQLAVYIVSALAFFKSWQSCAVCRIRGLRLSRCFNLYVIGYIGDTLKYNTAPFNRYLSDVPLAYALPILSIVSSMAWAVPFLGGLISGILSLVVYLAQVMVYLFVFQQYEPRNKFLFTPLSLIPVVGPALILYSIREYR